MGRKVADLRDLIDEEREDSRDISSDLTRQYKTMEARLMSRIIDLEERSVTAAKLLAETPAIIVRC